MEQWVLVQTKSGRENSAKQNAEAQGYETLLPQYRSPRSVNGRIYQRLKPLYPGYLFVHVVGNWVPLMNTYGVHRVVLFGPNPATVPEKVITRLREIMNDRGIVEVEKKERFKPDQAVRVRKDGALQGVVGLYQGQTDKGRLRVLFKIMGVDTAGEFSENDLEEVGD